MAAAPLCFASGYAERAGKPDRFRLKLNVSPGFAQPFWTPPRLALSEHELAGVHFDTTKQIWHNAIVGELHDAFGYTDYRIHFDSVLG